LPSSKPLTDMQRLDFLTALAQGTNVTEACKIAQVPRRLVYYWREEDPEFRAAWKHAQEEWSEVLKSLAEENLKQRALDPDAKGGHLLLMFLLKKLDHSYRDNYKQEITVNNPGREFEFSKEDQEKAHQILDKIVQESAERESS